MKRVRTKSSDIVTSTKRNARKNSVDLLSTSSSNGGGRKASLTPLDTNILTKTKSNSSVASPTSLTPTNSNDPSARLTIRIISHGRAHGPVDDPGDNEEMLKFSVRDVANPPAKLRKTYTGLSPRLRKEIFADKGARAKYDLMVTEIEKMMNSMEMGINYDELHRDQPDVDPDEAATTLIVSIQCEEGKHRSVAFADELSRSIGRKGWGVSVEHRDIGVTEADGLIGEDEEDLEEPLTPSSPGFKETVKAKKKKDKNMKKRRDQRLRVEYAGSGAEEGYI